MVTELNDTVASLPKRELDPVAEAAANEYLAELGQRLEAALPAGTAPEPAPQISYEVMYIETLFSPISGPSTRKWLNEPIPLPDGRIIVPWMLLVTVDNEAELAGMLGHAIAHEVLGNTFGLYREGDAQPGIVTTILVNLNEQPIAHVVRLAPVRRSAEMRLAPSLELEADRLTREMLQAAGYDPAELASYISGKYPATNVLPAAGLPSLADRLKVLDAAAEQTSEKPETGRFEEVKRLVRASPPPPVSLSFRVCTGGHAPDPNLPPCRP